MKQNMSKQLATILSVLLFSIALMLCSSAFADAKDRKINAVTYEIGDVLFDNSIVFWVDETGQHGMAAQPFDDAAGNWYVAKEHAENHGPGWRLPTKHELNLLFQQQHVVGGFAAPYYWSSTDYDVDNAWYQLFGNGSQFATGKLFPLGVRAVRAF